MELTLVIVIGIVSIVATAAVTERLGLAAPLGLVVVGLALSFLPRLPRIDVSPEIILAGVLPPLLYSAATRMPAHDFRRNFRPIAGLAVLLVVISTVASGYLFNSMLPGLGLASAFALGAIVSPTDAVAATAVGRRLGLPSRLLTILEGEGLVNDASALVLLSSAIAATTHSVHIGGVTLKFVYAVAAAVVIGVLVGALSVQVRSWFRDPVFNTAISFVVPFLAYVPAEAIDASGVLAVVVTGLVAGHQAPRYLRARDRLAETINWQTVAFLLEGAIFLFMGLQLKTLLREDTAAGLSVGKALGIGLLASALAVALRFLFVAPLVAGIQRNARDAAKRKSRLQVMEERLNNPEVTDRLTGKRIERFRKRLTQAKGDVEFTVSERFGWRGGVVLAWSGMRGAVTLAAAQTLPEDTPYRPQLILIAFTVAVTTLLVQGLSLPTVIRALKVPGDDAAVDREQFGELVTEMSDAAGVLLDDPHLTLPDGEPYADGVVERVRGTLHSRPKPSTPVEPEELDVREQYLELTLRVLAAQRTALLEARADGNYNSRTLTRAQRVLDMQEATLQQIPDRE